MVKSFCEKLDDQIDDANGFDAGRWQSRRIQDQLWDAWRQQFDTWVFVSKQGQHVSTSPSQFNHVLSLDYCNYIVTISNYCNYCNCPYIVHIVQHVHEFHGISSLLAGRVEGCVRRCTEETRCRGAWVCTWRTQL